MKGFVLLEMCLALLLIPMVLDLSIFVLSRLTEYKPTVLLNHQIFRIQMKRQLGKSVHINQCLHTVDNEEYTLVLHNNRIVQTPGYHILLEEAEGISCHERGIDYRYKGKAYKIP